MAEMRALEKILVNSPVVSWYHRFVGVPRVLGLARQAIAGPVLEVGCGNGSTTRELVRRLPGRPVIAIDFDPDQVRRAVRRVGRSADVRVGDVTRLEFPSNHFGCVVEMNVLHHIPNPLTGLREIWRVLRPGAQFLFMDYAWKTYPRLVRALFPPESIFSAVELEGAMASAGFDDVRVRGRRQITGAAFKPHG